MRLTVGPLPAAVYWRRRAVVLVGLAMVVLVISYACGGPTQPAGAGPLVTGTPTPTTTLLHPQVPTGTPTTAATSASPTPTATAYSLPVPGATGPCTDAEMQVTASAAAAEVVRGTPVDLTIKIKNISTRACNRDIGADVQELRIDSASTIIWSSDDCDPNHGHDDRPFAPGQEVSFTIRWNGQQSRNADGTLACGTGISPPVAVYQVIARLGQKLSDPFALKVSA